jgi:hypothetical protein
MKYEETILKNVAEEQKREALKGHYAIARATIYFDGKGNFVTSVEIGKTAEIIAKMSGETNIELDNAIDNSLSDGVDRFGDYLKACYLKTYENYGRMINDFIRSLFK